MWKHGPGEGEGEGEAVGGQMQGRQGSRLEGSEAAASAPGEDKARASGRGFLLITGAKLWFLVMGTAATVGLPLFMGASDFGIYNVVVNAGGLLNMVVITGTLQAVSKLVSERPSRGLEILRRAALVQCVVGVPLALAYILGAGVVAGWFADPSLAPLLRITGGVVLAYAFYSILVGYLNGRKAFGRQAALDVVFSTLKTALIIGAVLGGFGVVGALWGFVAAAVAVLGVAAAVVWRFLARHPASAQDGEGGGQDGKQLVRYLLWVMVHTFCVNGVLRADLFLLKAMVGAQAGGQELSNLVSGVYGAMQNVSRVPFQAVIAVTFVIFPMLSEATFAQDHEAARAYIRGSLRYSLILLALLSAVIAGNAQEIILALYGEGYLSGAWALMILGVATVGYALFHIATTMLTSAGRPEAAVGISALTLALTVGLNGGVIWLLLGRGQEVLALGAGAATAAAMVAGFGAAMASLWARYRAGLPLGSAARVLVASAAVVALLWLLRPEEALGRGLTLAMVAVKAALGAGVFVGVLALLREFTEEDRARLRRVLRRGGKKG
jgi:O-antigen/teichoic acid export membrane protein